MYSLTQRHLLRLQRQNVQVFPCKSVSFLTFHKSNREPDWFWTVALESVTNRFAIENCIETCSLSSLNSLWTGRNLTFLVFRFNWTTVRLRQVPARESRRTVRNQMSCMDRWFVHYEFAPIWEAKISSVERVEVWIDHQMRYDNNHTFESWRSVLDRRSLKSPSVVPRYCHLCVSIPCICVPHLAKELRTTAWI